MSSRQLTEGAKPRISNRVARDSWYDSFTHFVPLHFCNRYYFLISRLDGYSRDIVHWETRESMKEFDTEVVVQWALEKYPGEPPRIISDNGPQFVAKDFKEFLRLCGLTHVRTSPYYPQSKDHASSCTSLVRSATSGAKGVRSESLRPCCLIGPSCSTGSNRYCCLAL